MRYNNTYVIAIGALLTFAISNAACIITIRNSLTIVNWFAMIYSLAYLGYWLSQEKSFRK